MFYYKQHFYNTRLKLAKKQAKAKQRHETELLIKMSQVFPF